MATPEPADATSDRTSPSTMAPDLEAGRPIPDLLDHRGRLRRFGIAAAIATVAAVLAGTFAYGAARADLEGGRYYVSAGAWRFLAFVIVIAWGVTYAAVRWWLERRARAHDGPIPTAASRRRRDA